MTLKNSTKKYLAGFTLIELLIVMAMTAIIATITLSDYRTGEKQKRASIAADGITSVLTLAQTYALSGKATNNSDPNCRIPQYYVVILHYTGSYTLYAYDNCSVTTGTLDLIETFSLPDNTQVKASGLTLNGTPVSNTLKIAIYPPYGQIKASADGAATFSAFTSAQITIEPIDGSASKSVVVDGVAGRIGQ